MQVCRAILQQIQVRREIKKAEKHGSTTLEEIFRRKIYFNLLENHTKITIILNTCYCMQ